MPSKAPTGPKCFTPGPHTWKDLLRNCLLILAGNCLFAAGLNGIIIPKQFLSGGVIGIALIAHYFVSRLDPGFVYFLLNIPLILIGWFSVSRRFILYTAFGMTTFSLAMAVVSPALPVIHDSILAAVFGGVVCGAGAGITLRSQGSAGGFDILTVYFNKKLGLRMGTVSFLANALVLAAGGYFFSLEMALYSLIFVFTTGRVLDSVLTGFNQRKSVFIISDCHEAIADQILKRLHRGVTFLEGAGGYSGEPKKVIFSIITLTELSRLKEMVFGIDPQAFVVVNDTLEVLGHRHGSMRVY